MTQEDGKRNRRKRLVGEGHCLGLEASLEEPFQDKGHLLKQVNHRWTGLQAL